MITNTKISLFNFFTIVFFSLLPILTASCAIEKNKTSSTSDKVAKINELVSMYADYEGFNGSVLVIYKGETLYKKGFGFANMEWNIPNQVDTKFKIASITKQFTAMLIMQLVAKNKLDLHEPISKYLPDYPKENGNQITIHHLLTHSSGIARDGTNNKKENQPKKMVKQFASVPLQFKPGKQFKYSNSGYTVLGYIIETITGETYEKQLEEKIFKPLKMKNSGFFKHRTLIKHMASGYNKGFGEFFNTNATDESTAYSAGAIYSTVEYLQLWDKALQTETLLPEKYMDIIFKKHIIDPSYNGYYGYGWEIINKPIGNTEKEVETIGHSGSIDGFRSLYTKIPTNNSSIIFFNNTNRAFLTAMTTAITGILHNEPYDFPKKPLAQFMLKTIENEGITKGIQFYKTHKNSPEYHVSEKELIVAGYKLLHAENAKDAATVFKLSTEVFPDRDNPFDSYAEALMALGKNNEAIDNYKKSLDINPKNNNAIKMLKKLGVNYNNNLLKVDASWGKELFTIPLHFAKDIELKGFEEARFPKGWNNTNNPNFWTYVFAWKVTMDKELTTTQIEDYIKKYYDGLMADVNKDKDFVLPKTIVKFTKNTNGTFSGKATVHDSFITRKLLTLNFNVEQKLCEKEGKSILLFRISPQAFNNAVWQTLLDIKILETSCN